MTAELTRDSLLERASAITLDLHSAGNVTATFEGRTIVLGIHALSVLGACKEPTRLAELASSAGVKSQRDFVDFFATVLDLLRNGLLRTPSRNSPIVEARGWTEPGVHVAMLNDVTRTAAFIEALRRTVRPNDIVLDIGTGSGVLAVAAAKAGAKRVFAIEASAMAEIARDFAERNGVADRVEVLRGWSTRLKLADRATLLVTETIGNDPLDEHVVDILVDAHKRLLEPGARVVPIEVKLRATLVEAPPDFLDRMTFTQSNVDRWSAAFGMDFSALVTRNDRPRFPASLDDREARELIELSEPFDVGRIDFAKPAALANVLRRARIHRSGTLHGALLYFDVITAPGLSFTTHPHEAEPDNHWRATLYFQRIRSVTAGETLEVQFSQFGAAATVEVVG